LPDQLFALSISQLIIQQESKWRPASTRLGRPISIWDPSGPNSSN